MLSLRQSIHRVVQLKSVHGSLRSLSSSISDKEYNHLSSTTLENLTEYFDELGGRIDVEGYDCEYANGVLTLRLGSKGTYVLNRQPPNKQIWLSSPLSGPKRYDYVKEIRNWVYTRDSQTLDSLLNRELKGLLGSNINVNTSI